MILILKSVVQLIGPLAQWTQNLTEYLTVMYVISFGATVGTYRQDYLLDDKNTMMQIEKTRRSFALSVP